MTASEALNGIVSGTASAPPCPGCGHLAKSVTDRRATKADDRWFGICGHCGHVHAVQDGDDGALVSEPMRAADRRKLATAPYRGRMKDAHDRIVARLIG